MVDSLILSEGALIEDYNLVPLFTITVSIADRLKPSPAIHVLTPHYPFCF